MLLMLGEVRKLRAQLKATELLIYSTRSPQSSSTSEP